jgi:hypothetical protein
MNHDTVYYVGLHPYSFRAGQIAQVLGLVMFPGPFGGRPRACFYVRYPDGAEDYAPCQEPNNYALGSQPQLLAHTAARP